jgi:multiple sugar transport system substrate-binding protein
VWQTIEATDLWGDEAEAILKSFEDETGIKVEWVNFGPEWTEKASTALSAGSTDVDVLFTWATPTAEWARAGWIDEVGDRYTEEMKKDILEQPMQSVMYKGKIYGTPQFLSCQTGYYNTKLFEAAGLDPNKPPATFEEFIDYAKKVSDPAKKQYGFSVSWGEHGNLFLSFSQWTQLAGGDVLDENGMPVFNSPAGKKALQAMADGVQQGWIDPGSASYSDTFLALQPFLAGTIAMEFHWPPVWNRVNDPEESRVVGDIKMFMVPGWSDGKQSACVDGSMGWNMSTYSKNKDAAWEFMKWAAEVSAQKSMNLKTGWLPVRQSVFDDAEVNASEQVKHYGEQVKFVGKRYGSPYYQEMAKAMAPHLQDAINGKVSVEEGLAAAEQAAKEVASKYQ